MTQVLIQILMFDIKSPTNQYWSKPWELVPFDISHLQTWYLIEASNYVGPTCYETPCLYGIIKQIPEIDGLHIVKNLYLSSIISKLS